VARLRVSLVDDDDSCRESLAMLLEVLGHDVRAYASVEALVAARSGLDTDCLLLDATMRGATEPALLDSLKALPSEPPFIFVTGYASDELKRELLALGAHACLQKPFEEEELVLALERAVSARESS
jgi:two-component system, LuxR family, response regulator FixJ